MATYAQTDVQLFNQLRREGYSDAEVARVRNGYELAGRTFVDEGNLSSFVAVRIGSYPAAPPKDEKVRPLWVGTEDLRSLLRPCVEAEFEGFHVVYGVSGQPEAPYDLSHTRRLSWQPRELPR